MTYTKGDPIEVWMVTTPYGAPRATEGWINAEYIKALDDMHQIQLVEPHHDQGVRGQRILPDSRVRPAPRRRQVGVFEDELAEHLDAVRDMMIDRHKKYGPGNIAEFGELGLLVRLSDKMARLRNNQEDFSDESVDDTVSDIIGYALIWKMVRAGGWPSE